jgi:hypothetical protein
MDMKTGVGNSWIETEFGGLFTEAWLEKKIPGAMVERSIAIR